ncbi:phospholipase A2 inhibitor and Ly6/PLAUR domain-containing protein-like isoform X1 [Alosa sapidissima]|uniref:phospholipase A2 inhibitor and Ly6/PLAUR domain-containing protein-like isoform X1 n=1 Tax=Alosa sapidissima TaxID=34773 RepID=UPI001C08B6AF|nr:phospholipase A2 inhibitor and Ly6/PLAUR domain-containing protein-like isoform X1 [Alosa sapidissima]
MKPCITLGVLCALFSEVAALTCYQCGAGTSQTCPSVTCSAGTCASTTLNIYDSGTKAEIASVGCLPADQCITGSVNLGFRRTTMSTKCCETDLCNSQKTPELNTNTPNGKKCFTCEGGDCRKQLSCVGNEDRCVKATANVGGLTLTAKGCASRSICAEAVSAQLSSMGTELHCCEGNLCNSAKSVGQTTVSGQTEDLYNSAQSVGQSVLLLLGSLVSVLLFH